jgi:hypothetical protein
MPDYILPWSITCAIACSRIYYMLSNPLHPLHAHWSQSFCCGRRPPRSDRCAALPARPARAVRCLSSFSVGFNLPDMQYNIPALGDRCEVLSEYRWGGVSTRSWASWHNWSWAVQMVVGTSSAWNIQDVNANLLNIQAILPSSNF